MTASASAKTKVAIIGSGNIGTDLMIKIMRLSDVLEMGAFVGVDPESDGLKRAERMGVPITSGGIDGLVAMPGFDDIKIVFDATSAGAHAKHDRILREHGKRIIDLTPAGIGPFTIPPVNGEANLDEPNVNMVTCGGQATIPMVAAINQSSMARSSPRSLPSLPGRARAPTSTSSPRPRPKRSRRSAGRVAARRSSCSIRQNRRSSCATPFIVSVRTPIPRPSRLRSCRWWRR
jgi:hypothetical protein